MNFENVRMPKTCIPCHRECEQANHPQKGFGILAGVVSALILAAWFIGGRQPVIGGSVADTSF